MSLRNGLRRNKGDQESSEIGGGPSEVLSVITAG